MEPYYRIDWSAGKDEDLVAVEFEDGSRVAIIESYCTNPACSCTALHLAFTAIDENGHVQGEVCSFYLDTRTWQASRVSVESKHHMRARACMEEFFGGLDDHLKQRFSTRVKEAKEHGRRQWLARMNERLCAGYEEIFHDSDARLSTFAWDDRRYLVDDQYCINPLCSCNEVILSFVDITDPPTSQTLHFAIRVPLDGGSCVIEDSHGFEPNEIKAIHNGFMKQAGGMRVFKRRYAKMKDFGRTLLRQTGGDGRKRTPVVKQNKVGRNDPCPCGSRKKFKKCCGATHA